MVPQLGFGEALSLAFSRITDMKGRSRRSEFWWTYLVVFLGSFILSFIPYLGTLVSIACLLFMVPLMLRRMHDGGHGNGLVYTYVILNLLVTLLAFVALLTAPSAEDLLTGRYHDSSGITMLVSGGLAIVLTIANWVIWIICVVFWAQDSQGPNQYGPSPKYPEGKPQFQQPQQMYQQPQQQQ